MQIDWTGTALGVLAILLLSHLMKGKGHRIPGHWMLKSALALLAGVFLAFSIIGSLLLTVSSHLPRVLAGAALLLCLVIALIDIASDRTADKGAIVALALLPLLSLAASGPLAEQGSHAVTQIHSTAETNLGRWIGG